MLSWVSLTLLLWYRFISIIHFVKTSKRTEEKLVCLPQNSEKMSAANKKIEEALEHIRQAEKRYIIVFNPFTTTPDMTYLFCIFLAWKRDCWNGDLTTRLLAMNIKKLVNTLLVIYYRNISNYLFITNSDVLSQRKIFRSMQGLSYESSRMPHAKSITISCSEVLWTSNYYSHIILCFLE